MREIGRAHTFQRSIEQHFFEAKMLGEALAFTFQKRLSKQDAWNYSSSFVFLLCMGPPAHVLHELFSEQDARNGSSSYILLTYSDSLAAGCAEMLEC